MKKVLIHLLSGIVGGLIVLLGNSFFNAKTSNEVGFVSIPRIIQESEFSQTLLANLSLYEYNASQKLDSINNQLIVKNQLIQENPGNINLLEEFRHEQLSLQESQTHFQEGYLALSKQIDQQIWDTINTRIDEFGTNNNLSLILGAKGDGGIMFGDQEQDYTDDLLTLINTTDEN